MKCPCGFEFTESMVEMGSICPKCNHIPKERRQYNKNVVTEQDKQEASTQQKLVTE